ncbi:MAG: hypothetical protein WCP66_02680 [Methylococcales bacterium]
MLANLARGGVFGTGVVLVPETLYPLTLGNAYYGLVFFLSMENWCKQRNSRRTKVYLYCFCGDEI